MYRDQIVRQGLLTLRALKYYAEDKDWEDLEIPCFTFPLII